MLLVDYFSSTVTLCRINNYARAKREAGSADVRVLENSVRALNAACSGVLSRLALVWLFSSTLRSVTCDPSLAVV